MAMAVEKQETDERRKNINGMLYTQGIHIYGLVMLSRYANEFTGLIMLLNQIKLFTLRFFLFEIVLKFEYLCMYIQSGKYVCLNLI